MRKIKSEKNSSCLEAFFQNVLVCKNKNFRPFLEIFIEKPENITNQNLGTIAGIFEIADDSEDSSYVVNYLISVIKKEYLKKPKRGSIESLESALNKANLALSKLAEHGSISWVGKINAAVLVIEKNNIHISFSGDVKALLLRKNILTDIGENSCQNEIPSPFKTFIDVVSGRLEKEDKFIITTNHIFEIFSLEELKKSAIKFSTSDFLRFLKTALGNELERSAVLLIEILEKKREEEIVISDCEKINDEKINVFSQTAFSKKTSSAPKEEEIKKEEKQIILSELKEELAKNRGDFVDKKTGHIYIKESYSQKDDPVFFEKIKEFIETYLEKTEFFFKKAASEFQKKRSRLKMKGAEAEKETPSFEKIKELAKKIDFEKNKRKIKEVSLKIKRKIQIFFSRTPVLFQKIFNEIFFLIKKIQRKLNLKKRNQFFLENQNRSYLTLSPKIKKLWPDFSAIKRIFKSLNSRQKILAGVALFILLIVPYFISKIVFRDPLPPIEIKEEKEEIILPLLKDENVLRIEELNQTNFAEDILEILNLNEKFFILTSKEILDIENRKSFSLPANFSELKTATAMNDLNLLFLLDSQGKILSWSPTNGQFGENQFSFPEGSDLNYAQTFLTYLLVLDKNKNQIYRYPRADGGFGEKNDRLRENINLEDAVDMAVGENIFIAKKDSIFKFFQGKRENFTMAETATKISIDKIFTQAGSEYVYGLDQENARILKFDLFGKIVFQFYHPEISSANDFSVSEKTNTLYFSKEKTLYSFSIE